MGRFKHKTQTVTSESDVLTGAGLSLPNKLSWVSEELSATDGDQGNQGVCRQIPRCHRAIVGTPGALLLDSGGRSLRDLRAGPRVAHSLWSRPRVAGPVGILSPSSHLGGLAEALKLSSSLVDLEATTPMDSVATTWAVWPMPGSAAPCRTCGTRAGTMGTVANGIFTVKNGEAGAVIALAASAEVDFVEPDLKILGDGLAYTVLINPNQSTIEDILDLRWFLNKELSLGELIVLGQGRWPELALVGACRLEM